MLIKKKVSYKEIGSMEDITPMSNPCTKFPSFEFETAAQMRKSADPNDSDGVIYDSNT